MIMFVQIKERVKSEQEMHLVACLRNLKDCTIPREELKETVWGLEGYAKGSFCVLQIGAISYHDSQH